MLLKLKNLFSNLLLRYRNKTLLFFGSNVVIRTKQYGRIGNNIQQIFLLVAHYKIYGTKFFFPDNYESFYKININFNLLPGYINHNIDSEKKQLIGRKIIDNNMYTYTRTFHKFHRLSFLSNTFSRDSFLSKKKFLRMIPDLVNELKPIFKNYTDPKLITEITIKEINNNCVLHLRGGDLIPPTSLIHLSNPISFYLWLRKFHKSIIVVQEPTWSRFKGCDPKKQGLTNPILTKLYNIFEIKKVISGQLENDFAILANSKNIATSGIGTFPISACILNDNLNNIYYSNAFLESHLNPNFISNKVNKHCYKLKKSFFRKWIKLTPEERLRFSLEY